MDEWRQQQLPTELWRNIFENAAAIEQNRNFWRRWRLVCKQWRALVALMYHFITASMFGDGGVCDAVSLSSGGGGVAHNPFFITDLRILEPMVDLSAFTRLTRLTSANPALEQLPDSLRMYTFDKRWSVEKDFSLTQLAQLTSLEHLIYPSVVMVAADEDDGSATATATLSRLTRLTVTQPCDWADNSVLTLPAMISLAPRLQSLSCAIDAIRYVWDGIWTDELHDTIQNLLCTSLTSLTLTDHYPTSSFTWSRCLASFHASAPWR